MSLPGETGLTATEVRRICGDLPDATVEAILETGGNLADVEAAALEGVDEEGGAPRSAAATAIRTILEEDAWWDEDRD